MSREKKIIIKDYIKMWQSDLPDGHEIKIAWGDFWNPHVKTIRLRWEDRKRSISGRSQPN